jgi:hypothetical protein
MNTPNRTTLSRRYFLGATTGLVAGTLCAGSAYVDGPATRPGPRATSGDLVEPKWQEQLTITVGPNKGDLLGTTDRVLQAAVDYVAQLGGGTVQILPGTYRLRNAVYLRSNVRLRGSGADSILMKEPSVMTKLSADSDWYDQEITLNDIEGFRIGDGVCLRARNPDNGGNVVLKRTLVARSGNRFKLDRALRENLWQMGEATASTLFPILSGEGISGIAIGNLTLDGNKANNANLDGNYAGCIFLQDCRNITIRKVTARNFNGDGISWQICHDVIVEQCHSHDNTGLGLHPGSGSQRPIIRDNRLERNDLGLYFCWGVKQGVAEKNYIAENRSYGISIGHRDTDNLIRDNDVLRSGKVGILFRPERGKGFAPHRNRVEHNRIVDSGPEKGVGIDVQGQVESIQLSKNSLRETRGPAERVGIRIGADTREVKLEDNHIEGFATQVADLHKP